MACIDEKLTAAATGVGVAGGGIALVASTATGPAFFGAAVAWTAACFGFGLLLGKLAVCLENNGQPEAARLIRQKADAILAEVEAFKAWARSIGVAM